MNEKVKKLLIALAIPLAVGGLATLLSGGMGDYRDLTQPPLSPPGWVFPVVWSILYLLMGYASYRILESGASKEEIKKALTLYGLQLLAKMPIEPKLAALTDAGCIEDFEGDWLANTADIVEKF